MGSTPTVPSAKDEELALRMRAERDRLARALGLDRQPQHYRRPAERPFAPAERGTGVTLLFGGLTRRHELLIKAAMAGLGHDADALPCPDVRAFQTGKEYGNPGQCNPNYFTVGSLVRHLQELEQAGASRDEIVDRFVMVTGGACGPCRFGMYEAEYRLALRNSGFDGFRVALFDNAAGLEQGVAESGISFDAEFFLSLLYALIVGDLLNDVAYQIRPFEVSPGQTDQVLDEAVERLGDVFATPRLPSGRLKSAIDGVGGRWPPGRQATAIAARLRDRRLAHVLSDVHTMLGRIEVDRTRLRPIVKVTGEFWAQTTEGDGNFGMFRFLEGEGAQVIVEPVGTWITYLLHQAKQRSVDRKGIGPGRAVRRDTDIVGRAADEARLRWANAPLDVAEALVRREWERHRRALGGLPHPLVDQYELQRLAHPYYNSRAAGGEGHLEVAKNIHYSTTGRCHMVLSLKPFGCMPSTQSDAVQSAVTSHHPDMIFLPVETSGEGEINAHSRVQMSLADARAKARAELDDELSRAGLTLEEVREYAAEHPEVRRATYRVPHAPGVAGTAAGFVRHVAALRGVGT
jgi:predicted nucleotide-binding protein (sugar kinase/HSP70/actin superfamily)